MRMSTAGFRPRVPPASTRRSRTTRSSPRASRRCARRTRRCAMRSIWCWPSRFPSTCSPRPCRPLRATRATGRPLARARRIGSPRRWLVGIGLGWFARDALIERAGTPTTFARQAAFAHALYAADVNRPVEIWATEEKRLVNWLTKRLGFQVHAPDLERASATRSSAAGSSPATRSRPRSSCTRTPTSSACRCRCASRPPGTERDRIPLRARERRRRVLLDRRRLRLRALRQRRSRAAPQDRARRLRPARRGRSRAHRSRRATVRRAVDGDDADALPAQPGDSGRATSTRRRSSSISTRSSATST